MPSSARIHRVVLISCASLMLGAIASSAGCVCKSCVAGPGGSCRVIAADGKTAGETPSRTTVSASSMPVTVTTTTQAALGAVRELH